MLFQQLFNSSQSKMVISQVLVTVEAVTINRNMSFVVIHQKWNIQVQLENDQKAKRISYTSSFEVYGDGIIAKITRHTEKCRKIVLPQRNYNTPTHHTLVSSWNMTTTGSCGQSDSNNSEGNTVKHKTLICCPEYQVTQRSWLHSR